MPRQVDAAAAGSRHHGDGRAHQPAAPHRCMRGAARSSRPAAARADLHGAARPTCRRCTLPDSGTTSCTAPTMFVSRTGAPIARARRHRAMPSSRWAAFEKLGLGAPKLDRDERRAKHVVIAYRLLGFVDPHDHRGRADRLHRDDRVLLRERQLDRADGGVGDRREGRRRCRRSSPSGRTTATRSRPISTQAERAIAVQQAFQAEFAKAIKSDLEGRKAALVRMHELATTAASTRAQIRNANSAYASASQQQMAEEWKAGLIDRQRDARRQVPARADLELEPVARRAPGRVRDARRRSRRADAARSRRCSRTPTRDDALSLRRPQDQAGVRGVAARDPEGDRGRATRSRRALEREDKLLASLKQSSYLRALSRSRAGRVRAVRQPQEGREGRRRSTAASSA